MSITRSFANLITSTGTSAVADGSIVNADISSTAAIQQSKISGSPDFRNIVINGDMSIAQRSTSVASITTGGYYTVDRFNTGISSLGTWTQSQSTDTPTGEGFATSLKMDCTTDDASPSAGDFLIIEQRFEGQNLQYLKKGTASAVQLTASFYVKSTKTGTFVVELVDTDNTRSVSGTYTVNVTNTWEEKSITFPADTTGAFTNDNGSSLQLNFWLGAGTTFTSGTLATTWASTTNANRAVGQVNIADSTSNDWLITGVQLEAGTSASDFEFLPIDVSLGRCQRYFQTYTVKATMGARSSVNLEGIFLFNTPMRADPSAVQKTVVQSYDLFANAHDQSAVDINIIANTPKGLFLYFGNFSGLTQGRIMNAYGGTTELSAEL